MAEHGSTLARTLREVANYPPHAARVQTPAYKAVHHRLVVLEDRPCLICGVRNSTLGDPAHNPYGATAIETHHRLIEWALAGAVDLAKFNGRIRAGLLRQTGDQSAFGHDFTQDEMLAFVDHGPLNLWCLCDVHHRHPLVGIHAITGPIWGVQDVLITGFDLTGYVAHSPVEAQQLTALPQTTGTAQPPDPAPPTA